MISQEITQLRKAGKLEEALEKTDQALAEDSNNIWNKRAAAWVYYEYLKKYAQLDSYDDFKKNLNLIKDLELPEDEKMVFDNCGWQIGSVVYSLNKTEQVDYHKINELFELIKDFHFTKPSEAYTFIYKAFHKGYHNWSRYQEFATWWGFENFRAEDYQKEEYNDKKIMSIVEQAYIAFSKNLLEGERRNPFELEKFINKEKINAFLPQLDIIIDQHADYQYPPYYKAKLLLASGGEESALKAFLPFAKQRKNDFWVWELIAEIFKDDKEIQLACHCKALSLKTQEDFLVKTRQALAELLILKEKYSEAKFEIERAKQTYEDHGWNVPRQINEWIDQNWFQSANTTPNNNKLYSEHIHQAEEILFSDIPERIVAVEFVNEEKQILNFIENKNQQGFFKYGGILKKPKIGDILKVRLSNKNQDTFYRVLTTNKLDSSTECEAVKPFEHSFKLIQNLGIGFADNIFIDPHLIKKHNLVDGMQISGKAILTFNKKKEEWGWKAFQIDKL